MVNAERVVPECSTSSTSCHRTAMTFITPAQVSAGSDLVLCLLAVLESLNNVPNGLGLMAGCASGFVYLGRTHLPATVFGTQPQRRQCRRRSLTTACSRYRIVAEF